MKLDDEFRLAALRFTKKCEFFTSFCAFNYDQLTELVPYLPIEYLDNFHLFAAIRDQITPEFVVFIPIIEPEINRSEKTTEIPPSLLVLQAEKGERIAAAGYHTLFSRTLHCPRCYILRYWKFLFLQTRSTRPN